MVQAFILYFLNIKPTHGYEIQKFIQLNQMDEWTKIQSGSIYYALSKLEKKGLINICKEEPHGGKIRKIYCITTKGQSALEEILSKELEKNIYDIKSDKFVMYPFFHAIDKEILIVKVTEHIKKLKVELDRVNKWQVMKINNNSLAIEKICFELMINNIELQIKWHNGLLEEIDDCIAASEKVHELIGAMDFTEYEMDFSDKESIDLKDIKASILENPNEAEEILEALVAKIRK